MTSREVRLELGRKVAGQRRCRGWSQPELAARLGQPVSWVSRLERGLEPLEAVPVIHVLPRPDGPADRCEPAIPGNAGASDGAAGQGGSAADLVRALRLVLRRDPPCRARASPIAIGTETERHALAARVWDLAVTRRVAEMAALIGDLLPVVRAALRSAPAGQEPGLHQLAAVCYQACSAVLAKAGDYDGAVLAADRSLAAAACAEDPIAVAAGAYLLACILIDAGQADSAGTVAAAAVNALQYHAAGGSWTAISFRGALTLLRALAAVRAGDLVGAEEYLSRAKVMAGRLDYSAGDDAIGFSADHVALYEIAISIESAALAQAMPAL